MLPVFICEDHLPMLERFKKLINNMITIEEYELELVLATQQPTQLLNAARTYFQKADCFAALYLLDINLKSHMDGLQLARQIRSFDARGFIVFITSHAEFAPLTFKYQTEALDFICKDNLWELDDRIRNVVRLALERYIQSPQIPMLSFRIGSHIFHIEQDSILYIASSSIPHKLSILTRHGKTEFYGTLNEYHQYLTNRFVRCHRAYIVNINHIKHIDRKSYIIYLSNGHTCLASTRGINKVLNALKAEGRKDNLQ